MPVPNFFIVGAPKCGTTSLYETLRVHPQVFMPEVVKEPHYFGRDLTTYKPHWRVHDLDTYISLFDEAGSARAIGEASVWYLFSRTAAEEIYKFNPDSRIVIILRDPPAAMHAMHWQFVKSGNEDILDFAEAVRVQGQRAAGERIPKASHSPHGLQYEAAFDFAPQVRRYFERFGRDRVRVLIFEEFVASADEQMRDLLAFLGVDPDKGRDLGKHNAAEPVRNLSLRRFLKDRPRLRRAMGKLPTPVRGRMGDVLGGISGGKLERAPLLDSLRAELEERARPGVQELGELLGRDLSRWWATARVSSRGESAQRA